MKVTRMAYICVHCEGVYADGPVSQCDCMKGTGRDFLVGTIEYMVPDRGKELNQEPNTAKSWRE